MIDSCLKKILNSSVAAGVRNRPCLGWSVKSSGFPLRDSHGNPEDRCLAIDDEFIGQERAAC